jgi:hypothetical protein
MALKLKIKFAGQEPAFAGTHKDEGEARLKRIEEDVTEHLLKKTSDGGAIVLLRREASWRGYIIPYPIILQHPAVGQEAKAIQEKGITIEVCTLTPYRHTKIVVAVTFAEFVAKLSELKL